MHSSDMGFRTHHIRKGKPAARRGRKARGLTKTAQPPKLLNASSEVLVLGFITAYGEHSSIALAFPRSLSFFFGCDGH